MRARTYNVYPVAIPRQFTEYHHETMLKLCNIVKDYKMADYTVHALKGISLNFRKSEFVAVLGPSGCGKTTMLNIIGGLDRYTDGDLMIEGKSTKEYTSRDWDKYRNRTIGFIFQSYNLIPHLNVLQNVELALTISGVSASKKRELAVDALTRVGLEGELKKKPSQMSGGQMQRVAIARAIVNNPEIILADEPTGALDSETSEQIMDLLQEISDDRLVIMVTHNPELASRYATRTVSLKDGLVVDDTNPYDGLPTILEQVKPISDDGDRASDSVPEKRKSRQNRKKKKSKSEPVEAIIPGSENVTTDDSANPADEKFVAQITPEQPEQLTRFRHKPKKQRQHSSMNFFTALSLSARNLWTKKMRTGLTAFAGSIGIIGIALVLSLSNGFGIYMDDLERSTLSIMPVTVSGVGIKIDVNDVVNENMGGGDTSGEFPDTDYITPYEPDQTMGGVSVSANIITDEYVDYVKAMDKSLLSSVQYVHSMKINVMGKDANGNIVKFKNSETGWQELLWDDFMKSQYDVLAGGYPGSSEANAVQSDSDEDYSSYDENGKKARQVLLVVNSYNMIETDILEALGFDVNAFFDPETNTYRPMPFDEFLGKQFKVIHNDDYYTPVDFNGLTLYAASGDYASAWDSDKSETLTVVGILRIKEDVMYPFMQQGIAYTENLTELALANAAESEIAIAQTANKDINLRTGGSFSSDMSSVVSLFSSYGMTESVLVSTFKQGLESFLGKDSALMQQINDCTRVNEITELLEDNGISIGAMKTLMSTVIASKLQQEGVDISADVILELLNSAYQTALQEIGASDRPTAIYIYPASFDAKSKVLEYLDAWNEGKSSTETVSYTDLASTISEVVSLVVNLVSYVLIAFASISLVVSSIMIAIITYISVLERTVEIGVLRSIGARKIDVSNVFNAETTIIGAISGVLGVVIAYLITIPINYLITTLVAEAPAHLARLNPIHGILLVALSIVLNLIAGFIPAIIASKKDPVIALRSGN